MTKFDIKIKLNQMIREKIELKEDKKTKQIVIKRIEPNQIQKINDRTPLYLEKQNKQQSKE